MPLGPNASEQVYLASLRARVKAARLATGLSQEEVAERVGRSVRHYQRYEAQSSSDFAVSLLVLRRIAHILGADLSRLVAEDTTSEN